MEKMIDIKVEQFEENGEVYYLATSDDVQGLVAQGSTVEETLDIAKSLIYDLIEVRKEIDEQSLETNIKLIDIPKTFHQNLFVQA
jgi:predicted RNase H-like HicB family nuclease